MLDEARKGRCIRVCVNEKESGNAFVPMYMYVQIHVFAYFHRRLEQMRYQLQWSGRDTVAGLGQLKNQFS